jgi:hypothetical protein
MDDHVHFGIPDDVLIVDHTDFLCTKISDVVIVALKKSGILQSHLSSYTISPSRNTTKHSVHCPALTFDEFWKLVMESGSPSSRSTDTSEIEES